MSENRQKAELLEKPTGDKVRYEWLDALKGLAILSVVLGHTLSGYLRNDLFPTAEYGMTALKGWIYTWHMPLYFVLSGFAFSLSRLKDGHVKARQVKRGVLNLILIYLFFSIVLGILKIVFAFLVDNPMNIEELLMGIFLPDTLMWYLWVLILYYILFSLLIERNIHSTVIVIILVFSVFAGKALAETFDLRLCVENLLCCAFFFYMGTRLKIKTSKRINMIVFLPCLLLIVLYTGLYITNYRIYVQLPVMQRTLLETCNAALIIMAMFCLFPHIKINWLNKILVNIGKASLVIYLTHTYIVTAVKVIIKGSAYKNAIASIILNWGISTLVSYLLYLISRKIAFIGYIFKPIQLVDRLNNKANPDRQ